MAEHHPIHPNLADALEGTEADVAELDAIAQALGDLPDEMAPPAGLFERIAAAAFADDPVPAEPAAPPASDDSGEPASSGEVVPIGGRRRWPLLAVAAAVAVVAIGAGVLLTGPSSEEPQETVAELVALPGFDAASGTARIVDPDGEPAVELALADIEVPPDHHLELWLLDPAVEQIVSLGPIEDLDALERDGRFALPGDADLAATPIVDVSLEPDDGDPAHSGVSIVRGELTPA